MVVWYGSGQFTSYPNVSRFRCLLRWLFLCSFANPHNLDMDPDPLMSCGKTVPYRYTFCNQKQRGIRLDLDPHHFLLGWDEICFLFVRENLVIKVVFRLAKKILSPNFLNLKILICTGHLKLLLIKIHKYGNSKLRKSLQYAQYVLVNK